MNNPSQNLKTLSILNRTADSKKLSTFLAAYISSNNIPGYIHDDLRLAIEETFINITNYAFDIKGAYPVDIEARRTTDTISITIIDSGIAFNPLLDCDKRIENNEHCEGGMGIHIIKSLTDKQEYNRINQRNVFTVTKHYTHQHN
ncbi:MAG: ATP-binding protein [Gammaproteobacteria bacterium]|nr:ATP-binding protein [Gammaproteobacteria bacterium]